MPDQGEHPALKGYSPTWETVKETGKGALGGALKWGLMGAIAATVVVGGAAMLGGGVLAAVLAPVTGLLAMVGIGAGAGLGVGVLGAATGVIGSIALFGAKAGAIAGGAIGAAKGLTGAGEKIEEDKQRRIDNYERNEARKERSEMVSMRRDMMRMGQSRTQGVSPNALPQQDMGRGQQMA